MIGYITIGINNMDQSVAFYDAALAPLGYKQSFNSGGWAGYEAEGEHTKVYLATPHNQQPANFGNGSMIAFEAKSREAVDAYHAAALAAGGTDEGAPGPRGEFAPPFYGAYTRDPVGNKLCAFFRG